MISTKFDFSDLFIFDLANNHQGDLDHAIDIIRLLGEIARRKKIRAALKFQFRDLETFIHPGHQKNSLNKLVQRFLSTRLGRDDFQRLIAEVRAQGMFTMCTPFDESSVELIQEMDFDLVKIASCSAQDKPLLKKASQIKKPFVASTAGLTYPEVIELHSQLCDWGLDFALMHCVALYPTPDNQLQLQRIAEFKRLFPGIEIGYSTHENPNNFTAVQVAYGLGARLFEKHVGLANDKFSINAYSANPQQVEQWIDACLLARQMCLESDNSRAAELESLRALQRGVYVKKDLKKGQKIYQQDVFFAMPLLDGQLFSGDWIEGEVAESDLSAGEPIPSNFSIKNIVDNARQILKDADISLDHFYSIQLSHHYGLNKFRDYGALALEAEGAAQDGKKILVLLPGQEHPAHSHLLKDEIFRLLSGDLCVKIDGKSTIMEKGAEICISAQQEHSFKTSNGAVIEEISSVPADTSSQYVDYFIDNQSRQSRKTSILLKEILF